MNRTANTASVQDIINKMAGRVDVLLDQRDSGRKKPVPASALQEEIRIWMAVDPLVADLHKQYMDARAHHARLVQLRGKGDPMEEVAADMAESAKCAVETRLIELRHSAEAKLAFQAMVRREWAAREARLIEEERARASRFWKQFSARKTPRVVQRGHDSFISMMIGLMAMQHLIDQAHTHLSIAAAFCRVAAGIKRPSAVSG